MPTEKKKDRGLFYVRAITILVAILVVANVAIEATLLVR